MRPAIKDSALKRKRRGHVPLRKNTSIILYYPEFKFCAHFFSHSSSFFFSLFFYKSLNSHGGALPCLAHWKDNQREEKIRAVVIVAWFRKAIAKYSRNYIIELICSFGWRIYHHLCTKYSLQVDLKDSGINDLWFYFDAEFFKCVFRWKKRHSNTITIDLFQKNSHLPQKITGTGNNIRKKFDFSSDILILISILIHDFQLKFFSIKLLGTPHDPPPSKTFQKIVKFGSLFQFLMTQQWNKGTLWANRAVRAMPLLS